VPIEEAPDLLQPAIDMGGQEAQSGANPSDPFVFFLTSVKGVMHGYHDRPHPHHLPP
jgi:hypothetical protein